MEKGDGIGRERKRDKVTSRSAEVNGVKERGEKKKSRTKEEESKNTNVGWCGCEPMRKPFPSVFLLTVYEYARTV